MIHGDLQQSESYRLLPTAFQTAIAFLQQQDLTALALGRHDIDGDRMYANVMSFETAPADTKQAEVHEEYIDLQVLIAGSERIEFALPGAHPPATEYDVAGDYYLVASMENCCEVVLAPLQFAAFFPAEPHKPGCIAKQAETLKKVVVKIHRTCIA